MAENKTTTTTEKKTTEKAPVEKEPLRVEVVPGDGMTPQQRKEAEESNLPENAENRDKSYLPPSEAVNQNDPEEK